MKILLADDEMLVRTSLRYMLEEWDSTLEFTREAANGEEMLEIVKESMPDVAFVDIKMPKLTGLEAIRIGKSLSPHTQWVILTGYSEFAYAQEAIRLGAANYLLKPASPEDLEKTMLELIEKQQKQLKILQKELENDLSSIFHGLDSFENMDGDIVSKDIHYNGAVFYVDSYLEEKAKAATLRTILNEIRLLMNACLVSDTRMSLFPLPSGELLFIGCWGFKPGNKGKELVDGLMEKFQQKIMEYDSDQLSITMIKSGECTAFAELTDRIQQIQTFASNRIYLGIGKSMDSKELADKAASSNTLKTLSQLLMEIIENYRYNHYSHYMRLLNELAKYETTLTKEVQVRKNILQFLSVSLGIPASYNTDFQSLLTQLQSLGESMLMTKQKEENQPQDIIDQVISYINQYYMEDIGMSQIAEKVGVTPNYLSTLFRQKTGTTFMKYLTKSRMIRAKELLTETDLQVQQVANQVGYYSTRHFTKLFTEFAGCYPSEYKKQRDGSSASS